MGDSRIFGRTKIHMLDAAVRRWAMTHEEYDERYTEAIDALKGKHPDKTVGEPEYTPGGYRFVRIDGVPRNDHFVFTLAWDYATAMHIMDQKPH